MPLHSGHARIALGFSGVDSRFSTTMSSGVTSVMIFTPSIYVGVNYTYITISAAFGLAV